MRKALASSEQTWCQDVDLASLESARPDRIGADRSAGVPDARSAESGSTGAQQVKFTSEKLSLLPSPGSGTVSIDHAGAAHLPHQ